MTDIREKIKAKILDDMNYYNSRTFTDRWAERVAKLVEALDFECGNRCDQQNPCNAREALEGFKKELDK